MAKAKRDYAAEGARRNAKARAEGYASYAQKRLALGIKSGKTPEAARGRPQAKQIRVTSPKAKRFIREATGRSSKSEDVRVYELSGLSERAYFSFITRHIKQWDRYAKRGRSIAIGYVAMTQASPEYPQGYMTESFFRWGRKSTSRIRFDDLVADRAVTQISEWRLT